MAKPRTSINMKANTNGKKITITLALDENILNDIKSDAVQDGLSINGKINNILSRYSLCYKYMEKQGALMFPAQTLQFTLANIEEDKIIEEYERIVFDLIPSWLVINKIPITLENWIKYVCNGMLIYGGSLQTFSHYEDDDDHLCLVFGHIHGLKWSRVINAVYSEYIQRVLNYHTHSTILPSSVVIKILERNPIMH